MNFSFQRLWFTFNCSSFIQKKGSFFVILWATYALYCNIWNVCTLYYKLIDHYKYVIFLYAQLRNSLLKPSFLFNTWAGINLLQSYNLLPIKVFLSPFYLSFIYIKHINLNLDKAILIYVTSQLSNVHFLIYKEVFLCQKVRGIHGIKGCSGFSISQKDQFINSNLPFIHDE